MRRFSGPGSVAVHCIRNRGVVNDGCLLVQSATFGGGDPAQSGRGPGVSFQTTRKRVDVSFPLGLSARWYHSGHGQCRSCEGLPKLESQGKRAFLRISRMEKES